MKRLILIVLLIAGHLDVCAQRVIKDGSAGSTTALPGKNTILDLESSNKGFLPPRLTTSQRDAIGSPANGLIIYNSDVNCIQFYNGSKWVNTCDFLTSDPSTNGTGKVTSYVCSTASAGKLFAGIPVDGSITQSVTANVSQVGTYNIVTEANGIVFFAIGEFTSTGSQVINLHAMGTPFQVGIFDFTLNVTPNCTFQRQVFSTSTNGTGIVSGYVCNTGQTGTPTEGDADLTSLTQIITATVTQLGTYSIQTNLVNGIYFFATGAFTSLGSQTIVLRASGVEVLNPGSYTYTLNTTPSCSFTRTVATSPYPVRGMAICDGTKTTRVVEITSPTGRKWMDRNLGASRAATSMDDSYAKGCLYQWGRGNDGHASMNNDGGGLVNYSLLAPISSTTNPGHNKWITAGGLSNDGDWLRVGTAGASDRWQGVNGINNPCPTGFRLPTSDEISAEISATGITNWTTAYGSIFKFIKTAVVVPDTQYPYVGSASAIGYSTSTLDGGNGFAIYKIDKNSVQVIMVSGVKATGRPVRCIKN